MRSTAIQRNARQLVLWTSFDEECRSTDEWNYWPLETDAHLRRVERLVAATQIRQDVEERWLQYLKSIAAHTASPDVATAAEDLWFNLVDRIEELTPPDASPSGESGLMMSWDSPGLHLEIEIMPDASYEWFFRERLADIAEGATVETVELVPEELCARLRRVLS